MTDSFDLNLTRVEIPGSDNIRDLGGFPVGATRRIRRGGLYRAEALALPGASGFHAVWDTACEAAYRALHITTVIDLRTEVERRRVPSAWARATGASIVSLPIFEGGEGTDTYVMGDLLEGRRSQITPADLSELYVGILERRAKILGDVIRTLSRADRLPVLVHCSAGKDRTGTLVAVVLEALGVERRLVIADYQLTGILRPDRVMLYREVLAAAGLAPEAARVLFETPAAAMTAALEHLDATYGGAEQYLLNRAGVTSAELESLRRNLLEEASC